ncbi:MAG: leucine-rich repeat domain-containing protein [Bacteroidales bacterium]|nr:leucine-rich repeat domain-containing protein [Bacteroidales bacterium]
MPKIISKGRKTWKDGSVMTYTVTDDGVLTISGNLRDGCLVPFKSKAPFRHLVIADGIGYVGKENFKGLEQLEEVTLPSSVKEIRSEAFAYCGNLKCINIPEGLVTVGEYVFRGCVSLSVLRLPKTLSKIKHGAFMSCDALEIIRIPKGAELGDAVFCGCDSLREVVLPRGLHVIPESAFSGCISLESIKIPDSVEAIRSRAFSRCDKLQNFKFPEREDLTISEDAFGNKIECEIKGEDGVNYIGTICNIKTDRAWASIRPAEKVEGDVVVPSQVEYGGKSYSVTVIDKEAFHGMKMKSLVLPDSVVEIKDSAFENCDRLRDVYLGNNLKKIGNSAFEWCENLRYMPIPASVQQVGYHALHRTVLVDNSWKWGVLYFGHILYGYHGDLPEHSYIEVREGTTVIADGAFNSRGVSLTDYNNLEGIVLPDGIKRIGDDAFAYCKGLTYVSMPKSVEYIGRYSFEKDVKILSAPRRRPKKAQIEEPSPKNVAFIEETERYTLDERGVLTLKEDVTQIKDEEFKGKNDIKKAIIPGTVEFIGERSFSGCESLDGVTLGEGVRVIWEGAFIGCRNLKRIHLPASMETICSSAFSCCKGLQEAVVPSNAKIDRYAFSGCDSLKKVIIRDIIPLTSENH